MKSILIEAIRKAEFELPNGGADLVLTRPKSEFGDYATNVAMQLAKLVQKSPAEIATQIVTELGKSNAVADAKVAGPGFINLTASESWLASRLDFPHHPKPILQDRKFVIEYSSPNIAKPLHVGHLRTTMLGQTLVNLYRQVGADVVAWSHPGDWGVQFGKLIVGWRRWGNEKALDKDPVAELLRVYVKFHQEAKKAPELEDEGRAVFKALQEGDPAVKELWRKFAKLSEDEFDQMYTRLRVKFDIWRGESAYNDQLQELVEKCLTAGVAKISDGAVIIPLDESSLPPFLIRKSDGATLYATSDLVSLAARTKETRAGELIYVVGNEQTLHLKQLFAAAEKLAGAGVYGADFVMPKLTHVSYGFFRLATGKMSTREGEAIQLENLLDQSVEKAKAVLAAKNPDLKGDELNKLAEEIGVAAVKYTDLQHDRHTDVVFDWEKMFAFEGNSIVYLMYTYARCNSVLKNAGENQDTGGESTVWSSYERQLLLTLLDLDAVVAKCVSEYDVHHLLTHAYEVAAQFSRFYDHDPILKSEPHVRARRLKLTNLVCQRLNLVFDLLGIHAPEKL